MSQFANNQNLFTNQPDSQETQIDRNRPTSSGNWVFWLGGITILAGVFALLLPFMAGIAFNSLLGWIFAVAGVMQTVHAIKHRSQPGFFTALLSGLFSLAVGISLLFYPISGLAALTLILGTFLILQGAIKMMWSFRLRPVYGWGWLLFTSALNVVCGALILAGWPETSFWVIGTFLGIDLIFTGWTMISVGRAVRRLAAVPLV